MDWSQTFTIIFSVVGSTSALWYIGKEDMKVYRQETNERLSKIDDRFAHLENKWEARFAQIDEKWERLFERLLLKDQGKINDK
jgi:hypothetical protein